MGTALVTGGARGIGRGICKALADVGFDIACVSLETADEGEPNPFPGHVPTVSSLETLDELVGLV